MKRTRLAALCLALALTLCACGEREQETVMNLQAQYAQIATAQMEAEVTFHLAQENRSFTLQCAYTPEESVVTVSKPEKLKDVRATVTKEGLSVTFDGTSIPAGEASGFAPVSALPLLLHALAGGYLTEQGRETLEGTDCYRLTLDAGGEAEEALLCTAWIDTQTLLPRYAEFSQDGSVVVSLTMLAFSCTLMEE